MSSNTKGKSLVEEFIERQNAALRPLLIAIHRLMQEAAPEMREAIKWGLPCYEQKGNVCSIMPANGYVRLQFFRGADLQDAESLLEGTGKAMCHVKLRELDHLPSEAIKALVRDAVRVDTSG